MLTWFPVAIPFRKEISCITRDNFALFRLNLVQKNIYKGQ